MHGGARCGAVLAARAFAKGEAEVVVTVLFGAAGLWLKFACLKPYKERVARLIAEQEAAA